VQSSFYEQRFRTSTPLLPPPLFGFGHHQLTLFSSSPPLPSSSWAGEKIPLKSRSPRNTPFLSVGISDPSSCNRPYLFHFGFPAFSRRFCPDTPAKNSPLRSASGTFPLFPPCPLHDRFHVEFFTQNINLSKPQRFRLFLDRTPPRLTFGVITQTFSTHLGAVRLALSSLSPYPLCFVF